jgi:hypothetical protein
MNRLIIILLAGIVIGGFIAPVEVVAAAISVIQPFVFACLVILGTSVVLRIIHLFER